MDAKKFDVLAKTLASWSSRRKFLAGLIGGSSSRAVFHKAPAALASAQDVTPEATPGQHCTEIADPQLLTDISKWARDLLRHLPDSNKFTPVPPVNPNDPNYRETRPRFVQYVQYLQGALA